MENQNNKTSPWNKYNEQWGDEHHMMSHIIMQFPQLEKVRKWGTDIYIYKNQHVLAWNGFKEFFSIWFYNGVEMSDPLQVLIAASEGKTKALRQWRFRKSDTISEKDMTAYIQEAIQLVDKGRIVKKSAPKILEMEPFLLEA